MCCFSGTIECMYDVASDATGLLATEHLRSIVGGLSAMPVGLEEAESVDRLTLLEEIKSACTAAQVRETANLDALRVTGSDARRAIAAMEARYRDATGIAALKIRHNNVLGYFIETTATHAERMLAPPLNARFIHRQTTANQIRFTTVELSELETRILNARDRALEIEREIFARLTRAVLATARRELV